MTGEGSDAANAPLLGQVVAERYFVEKHLGEGGMGTVYRARHITLDKLVALKVLHGEFSRKQDLVDRFLQEAKAASRIRNAHVIDITDFGVTGDGYVFFAMEYLEGKDLHGLLKEVTGQGGLIPWTRGLDIFLQVCEALAAAHAEGIIHRDLKPENIFLVDGAGRSDYVKLLDFGIAKVENTGGGAEGERKLTTTGMLFGTPEYMAPEQARGEKPDHRVDVYAMGCMLFQFLTGTVPFKADSFMAILTQHMVEPVPEISPELLARSGAPLEILAVVRKALEKDREQRYGSMVELAAAVFDASSGQSLGDPGAAAIGSRNRITRPTYSAGDWTGAVRHVDDIEDDDDVDAVAQHLGERTRSTWLYAGLLGAALAGGVAAFALLSSDDQARAAESAPASSPPEASTSATSSAGKPADPDPVAPSPAPAEPASLETTSATPAGDVKQPVQPAPTAKEIPATTRQATAPDSGKAGKAAVVETAREAGAGNAPAPDKAKPDPRAGPDPKAPKEKTPGDDAPGEPSLMRPPEFGG